MKLKSLVLYQCWTTIRPMLKFYAILYGIIALGYGISYMVMGNLEHVQFNGVEMSCFIYLGITGAMGFYEDFKMALQNGYTRKSIFFSSVSMFIFLTLMMSLTDMVIAMVIKSAAPSYLTMFEHFYGTGHHFIVAWLWMALIYLLVAITSYFLTLLCNKIGKNRFILLASGLGLLVIILVPLMGAQIIPPSLMKDLFQFLSQLLGFTKSGLSFINPFLFFAVLIAGVSGLTFITLRKTELS